MLYNKPKCALCDAEAFVGVKKDLLCWPCAQEAMRHSAINEDAILLEAARILESRNAKLLPDMPTAI